MKSGVSELSTAANRPAKPFAQILRRWSGVAAALLLVLQIPSLAHAEPVDSRETQQATMLADVLVARPIGVALTVLGGAAFVVSLPFSALGGNVDQAAEALVLGPARETFQRCLGCKMEGKYKDPDAPRVVVADE